MTISEIQDADNIGEALESADELPQFHMWGKDELCDEFSSEELRKIAQYTRKTSAWVTSAKKSVKAHFIVTGFCGSEGEKYDGAQDGNFYPFEPEYAEKAPSGTYRDDNVYDESRHDPSDERWSHLRGRGRPSTSDSEESESDSASSESGSSESGSLEGAILDLVQDHVQASVDEEEVRSIVEEEMNEVVDEVLDLVEKPPPEKILVDESADLEINQSDKHSKFPVLYRLAKMRMPVFMEGRPGTGKNTLVKQLGDALDLPARSVACSPDKRDYHFVGYRNADGELQFDTAFREIWENGGLILLDEVTQAHPSVLTVINDAVANGCMEFADGLIEQHDDCIIMCADNTGGLGGTELYPDRNRLDAAFLDRFVYVQVQEDWEMVEKAIGCSNGYRSGGVEFVDEQEVTRNEWVAYVKQCNEHINATRKPHEVTPRAAFKGVKLLNAGFPVEWVKQAVVWKAQDESLVQEVESSIESEI